MDEDRLRQLKDALESDPDDASHHFNLGVYLWEEGGESREKSVEHFVVSAKLNPNNGAAFRFLGHYYGQVSVDLQRATKCYQRAVTLNPDDSEAGEGLCDLLDVCGKESLEVAVCREASQKSPRAFWAFRRLGYMLVYQKKWSEAIQSLQHAIRGYPSCADLWEALGVAYQRLGMFTAALKSYGRSIELDDSRVFALVESGNIHLMLGSYKKGVEQFRHALEIAPKNVAARYGLASGLVGLSKECITSGAFLWGATLLEEGSYITEESTRLDGNISSTWKLHGDIQLLYARCLPWVDDNQNPATDEKSFKTSVAVWKKKCFLAAVTACRSYQKALHLTPWQANLYTDIAISLDLFSLLEERDACSVNAWQLPEKMALGALQLEGHNIETWVVLGCLSNQKALKQHAYIRGLQLDVSFSVAWAYLGKLYRKEGEKLLAKKAFDHARSIDPFLALPWAGMSIDTCSGGCTMDDAYESCLRAVQTLPLADFQVGLGKLALLSGHLTSSQVFGALSQAVQRAPFYPESHNLIGLVYEAQAYYMSAVIAFRQAKCAVNCFAGSGQTSCLVDISINLARSLLQAGHASDAEHECEILHEDGMLDEKGQQIYALALWKTGKTDRALSVARNLAKNISVMNHASGVAAVGLICKLLYRILGQESVASSVRKIPGDLLQSSSIHSIVSVLVALDQTGQLQSFLPSTLQYLSSHQGLTELHSLIAIVKLIIDGSNKSLGVQSAVSYLRKVLHMFPDSTLIRNQLCSLLLLREESKGSHIAMKCIVIEPPGYPYEKGSKSGYEIVGSAGASCYASCMPKSKFAFPSCTDQLMCVKDAVLCLQRWVHQEPWNHKAHYLLILNVLQRAREEKFPAHLCAVLKRLVFAALSKDSYTSESDSNCYLKFQLFLCASEVCLQQGDYMSCENYATDALQLPVSSCHSFFAHLQLSRLYAAQEKLSKLKIEYMRCLQLGTDSPIGWICLKWIESRYKSKIELTSVDLSCKDCLKEKGLLQNLWLAIFDLVHAQSCLWNEDFSGAEQALAHGCSLGVSDSCLFLAHGAVCMELVRQQLGSQLLPHAVSSLKKAQEFSVIPLPIVSALLAQAEGSLGSRSKWERNVRLEWFSWPEETRPAELYFQMHLLAKQHKGGSDPYSCVELRQSPKKWILHAVHINPSCTRYWKVLQKMKE